MSIPDFVRTEWKSKGAAVIKFTDLNCNECQKKWNATSENYMNSSTEESCSHSKYITCSMSIQNVWEYEYKDHQFKSKTPKRSKPFVLQKPTTVPNYLWVPWKHFWNYYCKFFIDLDFAYRFPYLAEKSSHEWSQRVFESFPYLKNHIQYYGDVPDILEQLSKGNNSKMDEYHQALEDIWFDICEKRTYAELRLFFHVLEYPLNEEMKDFFSNKGITMDPSPSIKYRNLLNIFYDENGIEVRKKISVAGHIFEFTLPAIKTCHTYTHKKFTNMSEDSYSYENPDDADHVNENVTVFSKDTEMETTSVVKQTNFITDFDKTGMSHPDLDVKNKIEEHLEVTDEKENTDSINVNNDIVSDDDKTICNIEEKTDSRKKNSIGYKGIAWALNHIQQKCENTTQVEDIVYSTVSNGTALVDIDPQMKSSADESSSLNNVNETKDNQECDENKKIVKSYEDSSPVVEMSTNSEEYEKTKYEQINPEMNMYPICEESEEIFKTNFEQVYPEAYTVSEEKEVDFKPNYEENDEILKNYEETYPGVDMSNNFEKDKEIFETNYEEVDPEEVIYPNYEKNDDADYINENVTVFSKDTEMETALNSKQTNSGTNFDKMVMSHPDLVKNKIEEHLKVADKENTNSINVNNVQSNGEIVSDNDNKIKCISKKRKRRRKKKKSNTCQDIVWELNPAQQKSENSTRLEVLIDSSINNDNALANSNTQSKSSEDTCSSLNTKEGIEDNQIFDNNEKIVCSIFEGVNNDNEMEIISNKETNLGTNFDKKVMLDSDLYVNSEKNLDVEKDIKDHLEVPDKKENISPVILKNDEADGATFSDSNSETNCTANMKKRGGKKKKNSKGYMGVAWALNHIQQKCENIVQVEDFAESTISTDTAPVNMDSQMKSSVDESNFLDNEKETKDNQECNKNKKIVKTSYEDASSVVEMSTNYEEYDKTKYEQINPEMNMFPNYEESEEIVSTNYDQVYPEVFTNFDENKMDFKTNYEETNSEVGMSINYEDDEKTFKVNFEQDIPEINIYPNFEENDEIFKCYEEKYPGINMFSNFEEDKEIFETDYEEVNSKEEEIFETDYEEVKPEEDIYPNYEENEEEFSNFIPESYFKISDFQSDHTVFDQTDEESSPWYASFSPSLWFEWFGNGFRWFFGNGSDKDKMSPPEDTVTKVGGRYIFNDWHIRAVSMFISKISFLSSLFGFDIKKKKIGERVKRTERKCLHTFSDVFNVRKPYNPNFSSESLHLTKVEKSEDFRESYENLIKIEVNATNTESESFTVVNSYCMSEEDIENEMDPCEGEYSKNSTYPYISEHNEDDALTGESLTANAEYVHNLDDDISDVSTAETKIEDKSNNALAMEDWLYSSTIEFDENGDQIVVPFTSNNSNKARLPENRPLHEKIDKILKNCRLVRFSTEDDKCKEAPPNIPENLVKYWLQRYRLFLKYDEDIKLDNEAWFSVTPEMIAAHQAYRCSSDIVVDAFCGAGGNAIQLANTCHYVIAIDIDPEKIEIARHNARVYDVADRIEFIQGDFFQLAPSLKADAVLLSPPWGGIDYNKNNHYDVLTLGGSMNCKLLMDTARKISENIALYVPKSSNLFQIIELAGVNGKVDIEYNYISKKRKSITAYYGYLSDYSEEKNLP